jgi:hypothetical protein
MSSQILFDNYLREGGFNTASVSSSAAGFPATNVYEFSRRSKVWRTTGQFEVIDPALLPNAGTIRFQETIGVDLDALVLPGSYATPDLFVAAVKAALDLAGASTYTVSQDVTTKKIKIVSNGSGGGGIFRLIWTASVSATMAGIMGFSTAADDTGALTYTADLLKTSTHEFFLIDFGMAINPDAVVMSWRTDENVKISDTAVVRLRGNFTNDMDSSPYNEVMVKTDYAFFTRKDSYTDDGIAPVAYRFWEISVTDPSSPLGYFDIGSIFFGNWMNFSRGMVQFPFKMDYDTGSNKQITEGGQVLARKKFTTRKFSASWFGLTQSEKELIDDFTYNVSSAYPFYFMLDSGTVVSDSTEKSLVYCRFDDTPSWSMDIPGVFSCDMSLREEI